MPFLDTMVLFGDRTFARAGVDVPLRATEPIAQTMEVNAIGF
jgi:hypothetical protein